MPAPPRQAIQARRDTRFNPFAARSLRFGASKHPLFFGCDLCRHENGAAHSVQKLFVGRDNPGQCTAYFNFVFFNKVIRTKPDASLHCFQFAGLNVPVSMFEKPTFVKFLQDSWRCVESSERIFDPLLPLSVWEIAAERDAAAAPTKR